MPEKMLTVSFHHLVVEANYQIDFTGPIKESMASWIERICFDCVEPVKRRCLFVFFLFTKQNNQPT